jgi:hypothetical protein
MHYRTVQWGWFFLPVGLFLTAVEVVVRVGLQRFGELTASIAFLSAGLSTAIVVAVLLFSRQVVAVDDRMISTWFGFGWPRHLTPVEEVTAVRQVVNSRWYGWGIRKISNSWMHNTWGTDAVELGLAPGRVFRIGTPDPDGLSRPVARITGLRIEYAASDER